MVSIPLRARSLGSPDTRSLLSRTDTQRGTHIRTCVRVYLARRARLSRSRPAPSAPSRPEGASFSSTIVWCGTLVRATHVRLVISPRDNPSSIFNPRECACPPRDNRVERGREIESEREIIALSRARHALSVRISDQIRSPPPLAAGVFSAFWVFSSVIGICHRRECATQCPNSSPSVSEGVFRPLPLPSPRSATIFPTVRDEQERALLGLAAPLVPLTSRRANSTRE